MRYLDVFFLMNQKNISLFSAVSYSPVYISLGQYIGKNEIPFASKQLFIDLTTNSVFERHLEVQLGKLKCLNIHI